MGVQLACRIKAAKFLECSSYDVTDLKSINQNLLHVSARNRMHPIYVVFIGTIASGKTKIIQRFVLSYRLNVFDNCSKVEHQYHLTNIYETVFLSFIEIDGEEHNLLILDALPTDSCMKRIRKSLHYQEFFEQIYLLPDVIVIMFFAIGRFDFGFIK